MVILLWSDGAVKWFLPLLEASTALSGAIDLLWLNSHIKLISFLAKSNSRLALDSL